MLSSMAAAWGCISTAAALGCHSTVPACHIPSRVLHGVLEGSDGGGRAQRLAANTDFQEALLNCAVELVTLAWHAAEMPFPTATMQLRRLHK